MSSSSTITYTSVYTDSELGRVFWGADEELSDGGPEYPPSPDYVPDPEYPPSHVEVPYNRSLYPEFLVAGSDSRGTLGGPALYLLMPSPKTALSPAMWQTTNPEEDPRIIAIIPLTGGEDVDEPTMTMMMI
ncbi:hypothetical protein Tco_0655516 [Tanacetum coccineum]|uniref:Uncharacterized protein n=1 Tax=Tanacetum coccineum TaxID=301880 RepID=A0ABQ4X7D7_9ASTR